LGGRKSVIARRASPDEAIPVIVVEIASSPFGLLAMTEYYF